MSDTTPEPLDPNLRITLPAFEGPLDLLLHLIRKHELDILDLPIAFVTERYLSYVSLMEKLDLDIASEYLVMAATLAHIKSKMLLPQEPEDQADDEPEEEVDPRAELIRRLLEYQKYKAAAEQLGARGIAGRDVFVRGSDAPEASGSAPLASVGLFKLLDAFQKVLGRAQAELAFEITAEGVSIQDRMRQLVDLLRERRDLRFEQLFEEQITIYDMVVTFLALLEMAKRRLVRIYQADPAAPIHLRSTVMTEDGEGDDPDAGREWRDDPSRMDVEGGVAGTGASIESEPEARSAPPPSGRGLGGGPAAESEPESESDFGTDVDPFSALSARSAVNRPEADAAPGGHGERPGPDEREEQDGGDEGLDSGEGSGMHSGSTALDHGGEGEPT